MTKKDKHIHFTKEEGQFIVENGFVPLSLLLEKLPKTAKTKVSFNGGFSSKEELWSHFQNKFHLIGVNVDQLGNYLGKMGTKQLNVFENILDELYRLCEKFGGELFNSILEKSLELPPSKCNVRYFSVCIHNEAKESKHPQQQNIKPTHKITAKQVIMENVGTYIRNLTPDKRKRIALECEKGLMLEPVRINFRNAWVRWRESGYPNNFGHMNGINIRRIIVDTLQAALAAKK